MVTLRHFSVKMPTIVEGLAMLYKLRKDGTKALEQFWRSTNRSPIFRVQGPTSHTIVCVTEPDLIRQCLRATDTNLLNKPKFIYDMILTEWLSSGLLSANGETWQTHRKVLSRYFGYKSLPFHLQVLNKYSGELLSVLNETGNEIIKEEQFFPILYDQLLKTILEIVSGSRNVSRKETREFLYFFRKLKSLATYRFYHAENNLRLIWWLNPIRKAYDECVSFIKSYVYTSLDNAIEDLKGKSESNSCLSHMLQSQIPKEEIPDQFATLLIAGHETTDTALRFLIQHLAEHPLIQEKCQEEIDALFSAKQADLELTMEDIAELKYLERCILESLRITTTAPLFFRHLSDSMELGGYHLEKDTILVFSSWLAHRNPDNYSEPEEFIPDRFLPEVVKERHPYAFFPFSLGPRNCIGWKLAMMEMKTMMAFLLSKYTIHTTSKMKEVKVLCEITASPEKNFGIFLTRRKFN